MTVAMSSGVTALRRDSSSVSEMSAPACVRPSTAPSSKTHTCFVGTLPATCSYTRLCLSPSRKTPAQSALLRIHSTCSAEEVS